VYSVLRLSWRSFASATQSKGCHRQTDRQTERQAQYVVTCVNVLSQETPRDIRRHSISAPFISLVASRNGVIHDPQGSTRRGAANL